MRTMQAFLQQPAAGGEACGLEAAGGRLGEVRVFEG